MSLERAIALARKKKGKEKKAEPVKASGDAIRRAVEFAKKRAPAAKPVEIPKRKVDNPPGPQSKPRRTPFSLKSALMTPIPEKVIDLGNGAKEIHLPTGEVFRQDAQGNPIVQDKAVPDATKKRLRQEKGGAESFQDTQLEIDHLLPRALGGTNDDTNLVARKSEKTLSQAAFDFITRNERLPGSYKPENRQEGKMVVEWEAINQYKAGKISIHQARAAAVHFDDPEFVSSILGREFGKPVPTADPSKYISLIGIPRIDGAIVALGKNAFTRAADALSRTKTFGQLAEAIEESPVAADIFNTLDETMNAESFKRGLKPDQYDTPYAGTVLMASDLSRLFGISRRMNAGQSVSDADKQFALDYLDAMEREANEDIAYKAGATVRGSLTFMMELGIAALLAPETAGGSVIATIGAKQASRKGLKEAAELLAKKEFRQALRRDLAAAAANAGIRAGLVTISHLPEATFERMLGTPVVNEQGDFTHFALDGQELSEAMLNATTDTLVEVASEYMGGGFRITNKVAREAMVKAGILKALTKKNPVLKPAMVEKLIATVGWNGMIEELGEERLGEAMRIILAEAGLSDFEYRLPTMEDVAIELSAFTFLGITRNVVQRLATLTTEEVRRQEAEREAELEAQKQELVDEVRDRLEAGETPASIQVQDSSATEPVVEQAIQEAVTEAVSEAVGPEDGAPGTAREAVEEAAEESVRTRTLPEDDDGAGTPPAPPAAPQVRTTQTTPVDAVGTPTTPVTTAARTQTELEQIGAEALDLTVGEFNARFLDSQERLDESLSRIRESINSLEDKIADDNAEDLQREAWREELEKARAELAEREEAFQSDFVEEAKALRQAVALDIRTQYPKATQEEVGRVVDAVLERISEPKFIPTLMTTPIRRVAQSVARATLGEPTEEAAGAPEEAAEAEKQEEGGKGAEKAEEGSEEAQEGKKTQKEKVKEATKKGPKSIKEIAEETKILEPTVRRIVGVGAKEGTFKRVARGVYVLANVNGENIAYIDTRDAVESLKELADRGFKVDMVFLDPPYDTPAIKGGNRPIKFKLMAPEAFAEVMKSIAKIVRNEDTPVYYMYSKAPSGMKKMSKYTDAIVDAGFKPVAEGKWEKLTKTGKATTNVLGKKAAPEGLVLFTQSGKFTEKEIPRNLEFKTVRPKTSGPGGRQTQKPSELVRSLIFQGTQKGEIVLDPFAGSGVTPAEAVRAGRKAYAVEIDEEAVEEFIKPRVEKAAEEAKKSESQKDDDIQDSGDGAGDGEVSETGEDGGDGSGGAGKATPATGRSKRGKERPDVDRDQPRERPSTRLTQEEVEAAVASVTEINPETGEVKLTGEITDYVREAANQYKTGGVAKEGRGILDEYHTSTEIVGVVKSILGGLGLDNEMRVLEPSVGAGNFLYALPDGGKHDVVAHEIGETPARIAKIFHNDAKVKTTPFESIFVDERGFGKLIPKNYDLVIGNPPYGDHRGKYKGLGEEKDITRYEIYFMKRGLDVLKDGGYLAMVVPSSFLRGNEKMGGKEAIARNGELVRAYRLPNGVFEGTDIGTDILIFKRKDSAVISKGIRLELMSNDKYFTENPDAILGEQKERTGQFGPEPYVEGTMDSAIQAFNLQKDMAAAVDLVRASGKEETQENIEAAEAAVEEAGPEEAEDVFEEATKEPGTTVRRFSVGTPEYDKQAEAIVASGDFLVKGDPIEGSRMTIGESTANAGGSWVTNSVGYAKLYGEFLAFMRKPGNIDGPITVAEAFQKYLGEEIEPEDATEEEWVRLKETARKSVDAIEFTVGQATEGFPGATETWILEDGEKLYDIYEASDAIEERKSAKKKSEKVIKKIKTSSTSKKKGKVKSLVDQFEGDFSDAELELWRATRPDGSIDESKVDELPAGLTNYLRGKWYLDFNYAQGDIYDKLDILEEEKGKISKEQYERQKAKLEAVLPKRETVANIAASANSEFVKIIQVKDEDGDDISLRKAFLDWAANLPNGAFGGSNSWEVRDYVQNRQVRGNDKNLNERIRVRRREAAERLFRRYLKDELSPTARKAVEEAYNRNFNFWHIPDYKQVPMFSDIHSTFEGNPFALRDVQKIGIGRLVNSGGGIIAHDVGLGKTITAIVSANETMKRGWAKKPLFVVPSDQIARQWIKTVNEVIPNAKINNLGNLGKGFAANLTDLEIEDGSFTFLTYEGLKRLSFRDETYDRLSEQFRYIQDDLKTSRSKRDAEKEKEKAAETAGKMKRGTRADIFFEDLGFDHLTVDEAHNANHIISKVKLQKGQASEFRSFTQRQSEFGIKTWLASKFIQEENDGRNVNLMTATPFTNHPLEYYSMLSLVADRSLKRMGGDNVNEFFNMFMEAESEYEFKADGSYQKKTDVRRFKNFRQFRKLLDSHIDFKENDQGIVRPERVQQNYEIPGTQETLALEAQAADLFKDKENAGTLRAIGELRKIAFSPFASNFYKGEAPNFRRFVEESPKIRTLMALVQQNLKDKPDAGQIIYVDDVGVGFLPEMKQYLIKEIGLKPTEVEIISGATPKKKRPDIQDRYNNGEVKVILGSEAIKEGMNLQQNSTDLYILSLPWNFTQLRQVIGRAWRQGNRWKNVRINNLFMRDSIDVFLSQKLSNKQLRYEAALKSGDNEVDVGDVDYKELIVELIKDPETRAKLELSIEKETLQQKLDQSKAELAFVQRKTTKLQEHRDTIESLAKLIKRQEDEAAAADPSERGFYEGRIARYKRQQATAAKNLADLEEGLKARGIDEKEIASKASTLEKDVAKLEGQIEEAGKNFDQRVKEIADSMPERQLFTDSMLKAFTDDRAEQNKTFYQLREIAAETTVEPNVVKVERKNAKGTKVVATKKVTKGVKRTSAKKKSKSSKELDVLLDKNLTVAEKVDALLSVKQEGKKFKDVGTRVGGSKKERAAIRAVMESGDKAIMREMMERLGFESVAAVVNKDAILENVPKPDPAKDKEEGVPPLVAYAKKKIYNNIPKVFTPTKKSRARWRGDSVYVWVKHKDDKWRSSISTGDTVESALYLGSAFEKYQEILRDFVTRLSGVKTLNELAELWDSIVEAESNGGLNMELPGGTTLEISREILGSGSSLDVIPHPPGYWTSARTSTMSVGRFNYLLKETTEDKELLKRYTDHLNNEKWWAKALGKGAASTAGTDLSHGNFKPMDHIRRTSGKVDEKRVTAKTLQEDLGFKSVQFGNYMDDVTSKEHVRHTIGAVEDMSTALGVNMPKLIDELGLSIAYGARGGSRFLAHYEPGKNIINLTKGKGDGSFFHEFVHFLDSKLPNKVRTSGVRISSQSKRRRYTYGPVDEAAHYLMSAIRGDYYRTEKKFEPGETDEKAEPVISEMYEKGKTFEEALEFLKKTTGWRKKLYAQSIADVYRKPVEATVDVWNEPTDFIKKAQSIGGAYWYRNEELLARAGQAYIEDKMKEKGMVNDYVTRSTIDNDAYPQGEERKRINAEFDKFFRQIALVWPNEGDKPKFKTFEGATGIQTMTEAAAVLDDYKRRLAIDFDVHFVDAILAQGELSSNALGGSFALGVTVDNTITLLKQAGSATAEHELVHLTMANLDRIDAFKRQDITRDKLLDAKAEEMAVSVRGNEDMLEEKIAQDFEAYLNGREAGSIFRKFFITLKRLMLRVLRAVRITGGDIIRDYYDTLYEGESVERTMVELENKGVAEAFIEDGVMTLDDLEQVEISRFKVEGTPELDSDSDIPRSWDDLDDAVYDRDAPDLKKMGFGSEAMGFGESAGVFTYKGKPVVATHWLNGALDGFSIAKDFRGKGVATALIRDLLREEEGVLYIEDPNNDMMRVLERVGDTSVNTGTGTVTLTARMEVEPLKFKLSDFKDKRLKDLAEKANEMTEKVEKTQDNLEKWKEMMEKDIATRENTAIELTETPENIKRLSRFRHRTGKKAGQPTPRAEEFAESEFADTEAAFEEMSDYLKRKAQLIETRNRLRILRRAISQARKQGRVDARELRDLARRLKLRERLLQRNDYYIEIGRTRGKKDAFRIVKQRKVAIRHVRNEAGITPKDMREIIKSKNFEVMTESDFNDFLSMIAAEAGKLKETKGLRKQAAQLRVGKQLKNTDALRKAMGLPKLGEMNKEQVSRFMDALGRAHVGDRFLSRRQLETIHRTDWGKIETARELAAAVERHMNIPRGSMKTVKAPTFLNGIMTPWIRLARKHPFFNWVVGQRFVAQVEAEREYHAIEENIYKLTNAARRSRMKTDTLPERLGNFFAPTDSIVFQYIESSDKEAYAKEAKMTPEEITLADYLIAQYHDAYEYLTQEGQLDQGRANYITHVRRSFLETVKDEGIKAAVGEFFDSHREEEAVFNILDGQTGKVIAFEKFFGYALRRTGGLKPSENVAKASLAYFRALTRKKALDKLVPDVMLAVRAHELVKAQTTPKGLEKDPRLDTFIKRWLNDAKGRRINLLEISQGDAVDTMLKLATAWIAFKYLGFAAAVGVASFIGDAVAVTRATTLKEFTRGIGRSLRFKKSSEVSKNLQFFMGKHPFEELMDPASNLPSKVKHLAMLLFSMSNYESSKFFIRAKLTPEEFDKAVVSDERMAELARNLSKWRQSKFYIPSLAGHTTVGKTFLQFKTWATPILNTTLSDLTETLNMLKKGDPKRAITSEEARSLVLTMVHTSVAIMLVSLAPAPDDDDDSIYAQAFRKAKREMTSLYQAIFMPSDWYDVSAAVPLIRELISSIEMVKLVWSGDTYQVSGKGYIEGEPKWWNAAYKVFTPRFIRQFTDEAHFQERDAKSELIEEAARTGDFDPDVIGRYLNPERWEEEGEDADKYRARVTAELTIRYNLERKYPNSRIADAVLEHQKNADRVAAMLTYANDVGIEAVRSEVRELHEDKELWANPDRKTGKFISDNLYKAFKEAAAKYAETP